MRRLATTRAALRETPHMITNSPRLLLIGNLVSHLVENALEMLFFIYEVKLSHSIFKLSGTDNFLLGKVTFLFYFKLEVSE